MSGSVLCEQDSSVRIEYAQHKRKIRAVRCGGVNERVRLSDIRSVRLLDDADVGAVDVDEVAAIERDAPSLVRNEDVDVAFDLSPPARCRRAFARHENGILEARIVEHEATFVAEIELSEITNVRAKIREARVHTKLMRGIASRERDATGASQDDAA